MRIESVETLLLGNVAAVRVRAGNGAEGIVQGATCQLRSI